MTTKRFPVRYYARVFLIKMDKHFISVADPSSKTISGHKSPCNIQPPSSEVREAEGIVLAISVSTSMLTFTSPLKENKETIQMVTISGPFLFLSAVIVVTDYQDP